VPTSTIQSWIKKIQQTLKQNPQLEDYDSYIKLQTLCNDTIKILITSKPNKKFNKQLNKNIEKISKLVKEFNKDSKLYKKFKENLELYKRLQSIPKSSDKKANDNISFIKFAAKHIMAFIITISILDFICLLLEIPPLIVGSTTYDFGTIAKNVKATVLTIIVFMQYVADTFGLRIYYLCIIKNVIGQLINTLLWPFRSDTKKSPE
jgi:hypothetical protein